MTDVDPLIPAEPTVSPDIDQVRDLILATHVDIVPELIVGESIADLVASIDGARAAFSRVVASVPQSAVTIPAGGNAPVMLDADALPTSEKIRRGLAANTRKD